MNFTFHVMFNHKDGGHATSMRLGSLKEVKKEIEAMKPNYTCTSIEIILDITEIIKNNEQEN